MTAVVDGFSLATIPLVPLFNEQPLGTATGFVWQHEGQDFLVTNWHVVAGRNADTNQVLNTMGGIPNKIGLYLKPSTNSFGWFDLTIDLIDKNHAPLWLVHASHGREVDVVAIRLPEPPVGSRYLPINRFQLDSLQISVGFDVFVLGYPFGFKPPGMPVWKRGSIASEPTLAPMTGQYFLVDTASRPGMSGAPVIRRTWVNHIMADGSTVVGQNTKTDFIGIYSGRLYTPDQSDAQLARVWPRRLLEQMFEALTKDQSEHF